MARPLCEKNRMTLRRATMADVGMLWEWRNDEETRQWSRSQERVPWETHVKWLTRRLEQTNYPLWVAERTLTFGAWCSKHESVTKVIPVGVGRIDPHGEELEVSVTIAPEWRGNGFGTKLVQALVDTVPEGQRGRLIAQVKLGNKASVLALERAGFLVTMTMGGLGR